MAEPHPPDSSEKKAESRVKEPDVITVEEASSNTETPDSRVENGKDQVTFDFEEK